eukprot:CAMPEP_0177584526 /NCGR_PEP_ID=MMETSP0419_2-20121207/3945_1 /TAXON_ID=582737 /ORGANISM="Tetraselmis sp., Strain GSL018" /LENGTH=62 /DNA_ID=CAMNT_0019074075 /DNA_START=628 /DNA_END=812 /DNA_ORIENTATION=-
METASLAAVKPPAVTYQHHLQDIVAGGALSAAQLETIVYANMRFSAEREHYIFMPQQLPAGG